MLVHVRERLTSIGDRGRGHRAAEAPVVASTRRWSSGARSSTTSTTWSASGSSSSRRRTAGPRSGAIHAIWAPVQGRFKDYINTPKFNLYQSLHTTVIGLEGKPSRCRSAPRRCTTGPSTASPPTGATRSQGGPLLRRWRGCSASPTVDRQTDDPIEFLEALKLDLEQDEVYVFTPKGKVIALPASSTPGRLRLRHPHRGRPPLHRRQGQRPAGAARDARCSSADTVEIFTSKSPTAGPSRDWLQIVASTRARNKIRQWFSRERREDAIENGPGGADQGAAPGGPARCRSCWARAALAAGGRADELRRPRRAATPPSARTRSRPSRSSSACPRRCGAASDDEQLPDHRAAGHADAGRAGAGAPARASTSRGSTT